MVSSPDTPGLPEPDESRFLKSVNDYKEQNWSNTVSFPILALKKKNAVPQLVYTLLHWRGSSIAPHTFKTKNRCRELFHRCKMRSYSARKDSKSTG